MFDIAGSLRLLHSPHVRERYKAMLRSIMVGAFGMDYSWVMSREKSCLAGFAAVLTRTVICRECPHSPLVQIRERSEFHTLTQKG